MRRTVLAVVAAGLVGTAVPAAPALATVPADKPAFGGFSAESTATPIKIEVYEPTIPIPAEPQGEVDLAYTHTESATGPNAHGRASWLWPGDPVGEGFKTFVEQLGLPKELGQAGYPVQVNSETPGGPDHEAQEPFPGTVMRTSSDPKQTVAKAGWSPDGDVSDDDQGKGGDGPPAPPVPPVPSVPGAPSLPGLGDLSALGAAITGKKAAAAADDPGSPLPDSPSGPALPPEVAALVDVGGMTSVSRSAGTSRLVTSKATSKITDLSLLAGLITADSVKVVTTATSNGRKATAAASTRIVGLAVAGKPFTIDRDGVHAVGQPVPVPGLPADPATVLDQLGISFVLPKGTRTVEGADGEAVLQGLQVVIDARVLRSKLDGIPFDDIVNAVPDQAGELKSALGAAVHLAPKLVITTGSAAAEANTVPAIDLPDLSGITPPGSATGAAGTGAATGTAGTSGGSVPAAGGGAATTGSGAATPTDVAIRNAGAGLPPLGTVPGALLVGGILLASGLGWWMQKIGAFVIGGAGACSHGLETGVPDLRKA